MPKVKSRPAEPDIPPSVDPATGISLLKKQIEKAKALLSSTLEDWSDHTAWNNTTRDYLIKTFGSASQNVNAVIHASSSVPLHMGMSEHETRERRKSLIENQIKMLSSCVEQLETQLQLGTTEGAGPTLALEGELHPRIVKVCKDRFDSGHYADAVEAAFKEINSIVKELVKRRTGQEFDGADLMNRAFSPSSPIITLADLSTESGRDMQKGYILNHGYD